MRDAKLKDGHHLFLTEDNNKGPPTKDHQKRTPNKGPPTQNNVLDIGYAGGSLSNELSNNLKDTTWNYINKPLQRSVYGNCTETSLTAGSRQTALLCLCLCLCLIVNAEDVSKKL